MTQTGWLLLRVPKERRCDFGMNLQDPAITVLMGVYNGGQHVKACIESILQQTFANFEFLIFDDASTDETHSIVEQMARTDPRIRYVHNEVNVGLGAILNRGVAEARAPLVARMDADDIAVPYRLEKQFRFLQEHPEVDIVGSFALDVAQDGAPIRERKVPVTHEKIAELVWSNPFIHPTVMFRRDAVLRVGSYSASDRRRQDYELWFRCVAGGLRMANIPEALVHYRFSEETMKRNHVRSMWEQAKIGLRGCRLVRAPAYAYVATCMPLLESLMPSWMRYRFTAIKARFDPRRNV